MSAPDRPTCPTCGDELILAIDPATPCEDVTRALLADPPFHLVCETPDCLSRR